MPEPRKRVVLLHKGGVHRIIGLLDPSIHTPRKFIEFDVVTSRGQLQHTSASLVAEQSRFVLYREGNGSEF